MPLEGKFKKGTRIYVSDIRDPYTGEIGKLGEDFDSSKAATVVVVWEKDSGRHDGAYYYGIFDVCEEQSTVLQVRDGNFCSCPNPKPKVIPPIMGKPCTICEGCKQELAGG